MRPGLLRPYHDETSQQVVPSAIGLQAVVNIGVSIGAFPTKGLPLPFVSYGGSALIFNMMAVALLLNISRVEDL